MSRQSGWLADYFDLVCCICLPNRKEHMQHFFATIECEPIWIEPVMKDQIDMADTDIVSVDAGLRTGQVACHLSHMKALNMLLTHKTANTILVFEDDLSIPKDTSTMKHVVHEVCRGLPSTWEALYFGKCWESCMMSKSVNKHLLRTKSALCRHAIAFSRPGAQKVMDQTIPMIAAGDQMIRMMLADNRLEGYSLRKPIFYQNREKWGSSLGNISMFGLQTCQEDTLLPVLTIVAIITVAVALCKMKFAKV